MTNQTTEPASERAELIRKIEQKLSASLVTNKVQVEVMELVALLSSDAGPVVDGGRAIWKARYYGSSGLRGYNIYAFKNDVATHGEFVANLGENGTAADALCAAHNSLVDALSSDAKPVRDGELPPLPEPDGYAAMTPNGSIIVPPSQYRQHNAYAVFTADQMRDYARAAMLSSDAPAGGEAGACSCAECGKTSTKDSMWALYCLDCIQEHSIGGGFSLRPGYERLIDEYIENYEFTDGDAGYHDPSEFEQAMIKDAFMGFDFSTIYTHPQPARTAEPLTEGGKTWAIDHSAGRPILVLNGCSVIEAEDAEYVLSLIRNSKPQQQQATPAWEMPDAPDLFKFINSQPILQSLLYDINLLPECCQDAMQWYRMVVICNHFELSIKKATLGAVPDGWRAIDTAKTGELVLAFGRHAGLPSMKSIQAVIRVDHQRGHWTHGPESYPFVAMLCTPLLADPALQSTESKP